MWWAFCIGRAILAVPEYGHSALRDASQALDSFYLIVGFTFARKSDNIERLFRWLPTLLIKLTWMERDMMRDIEFLIFVHAP